MTKQEHLQWVKDRAKAEFEYYCTVERGGFHYAEQQAMTSILSDLRKHEETQDKVLEFGHISIGRRFQSKEALFQFIDTIGGLF